MFRALALTLVVLLSSCTCTPAEVCEEAPQLGAVRVTFEGLPSGVEAPVKLTGPGVIIEPSVASSGDVPAPAGPFSVAAEPVLVSDPLVRSMYLPRLEHSKLCVRVGAVTPLSISWSKVATSNSLHVITANSTGQLATFTSSALRASATTSASVVSSGAFGKDVAFDREGNLWTLGPTTTDATLNRFTAADFASSGRRTPSVAISFDSEGCFPFASALAFAPDGAAFVSSPCKNLVYRVDSASLRVSGTVTPGLSIPVQDPGGLAFDSSGNLWVASSGASRVLRYDAAQLAAGTVSSPAFQLGALRTTTSGDSSLLEPSWLAFDAAGDLWANDFGANLFFRLPASSLSGSGTSDVQPAVRVTVSVLAVLEGFAFDDEGGLWSAGAAGTIVRLSPGQLTTSSTSASPTVPERVLRSPDLGSAANLAFFPAPRGTPLFHAR